MINVFYIKNIIKDVSHICRIEKDSRGIWCSDVIWLINNRLATYERGECRKFWIPKDVIDYISGNEIPTYFNIEITEEEWQVEYIAAMEDL